MYSAAPSTRILRSCDESSTTVRRAPSTSSPCEKWVTAWRATSDKPVPSCARCALGRATLREYPADQCRFGEGPLPGIVVHAGVFRVERMRTRFLQGRDAI